MESIERKSTNKSRVIVSMTSFPEAIPYAIKAVESLLQGTELPDKLILYLTFDQFGEKGLPQELLQLQKDNEIFEVRDYPNDIRSYRKLIPALIDFPDDIIVTVDDDVHYHPNMLKDLLKWHERHPDAILAHRAKHINLDKPYKNWKKLRWYNFLFKKIHKGYDVLQTGCAGVLYPANSLPKDMMKEELFTGIAPTTDDIWFWGAGVVNGYPVMAVPFGRNKPKGLDKPKNLSLKMKNFKRGEDRNKKAMEAMMDKYPIIRKRVEESMKK